MTKLLIDSGICGMQTTVAVVSEDGETVTVRVESPCGAVQKMMTELGEAFDVFDVCMVKPGEGPFYSYAAEHFPGHAGCPVCAGIAKCIEAECRMALKKDASIRFLAEEA